MVMWQESGKDNHFAAPDLVVAGHDRGPRRNRASPVKSARGAQRSRRNQQKKGDTLTLTQMAGGSGDTMKKDEGPDEVITLFSNWYLFGLKEFHVIGELPTTKHM